MIEKYKDKKGNTYYYIKISVIRNDGKRIQKRFSKDDNGNRFKSIKKAYEFEINKKVELKARINREFSKLKFSEWHEHFLAESRLTKTNGTCYQYDGDLKKWLSDKFRGLPLDQITRNDINQIVFNEMISKGSSPFNRRKILKSLNAIFNEAVNQGHLVQNPAKGIAIKIPEKEKQALTPKEVNKFLYEAKLVEHPFYHLWAFALLTGMRSGEMYGLRWEDINLERGMIRVSRQWTSKDGYHATKTNKNRSIPISKELESLLIELQNIGPFEESLSGLDGSKLYCNDLVLPRSKEWRFGQQAQVTRDFLQSIGIRPVKFHDLRATFITNLLLSPDVKAHHVMAISGHRKTSTMDIYVRLAGIETRGKTDNLSYKLPEIIESDNVLPIANFQIAPKRDNNL